MGSLPDLDRRLSRKIETGKAINLTAEDLDLLVSTGAIDTFRAAVQKFQREQCRARSARNRSISGVDTPSIAGPTGITSKSSGMTNSESVSEARARALRLSGKGAQH